VHTLWTQGYNDAIHTCLSCRSPYHTRCPRLSDRSNKVESDLNAFKRLYDLVVSNYHASGQPLHLADPNNSIIRIMTLHEFNAYTANELQDIFRRQHIVVTGFDRAEHEFDLPGLQALTEKMYDRVFTLQGMYSRMQ
jgi:hypothetical protein